MNKIHYTHCPVCASNKLQTLFAAKDYTVSGLPFFIVECRQCTLRFTQDVPDEAHIGAYYKSEEYISHTNTSKGLVNGLYQKVRLHTIQQKARIIKKYTGLPTGSLLDVGCGTGAFLHSMQQQGWATTGLEPDADARQMAHNLYGLQLQPAQALFSLAPNSFDAITLWHVLEHVHALQAYVQQLKALLTTQGKLFIAVPNYTSTDARHYKAYWAAYDVPRHLYHFSPKAMYALLQQHRLKIIAHLPMWFDSFYVSLLSSKYKAGSTRLLASGIQGLLSNANALANYKKCSSIIYVIEK